MSFLSWFSDAFLALCACGTEPRTPKAPRLTCRLRDRHDPRAPEPDASCCYQASGAGARIGLFGAEWKQLVLSCSDHGIGRLGHFLPRAGQVADRLGDHEPRVVGYLAQDRPVGVLLAERTDVAGEEQRP